MIARSSTDAVVDASLMGRRAGGLAAVLGASGDLCASSSTPCQQSRAVARGRRRCGGALRGRLEPLARRGLCASHCPRTGPNRMHSVRMRANSLWSSHPARLFRSPFHPPSHPPSLRPSLRALFNVVRPRSISCPMCTAATSSSKTSTTACRPCAPRTRRTTRS